MMPHLYIDKNTVKQEVEIITNKTIDKPTAVCKGKTLYEEKLVTFLWQTISLLI